VQKAHDENSAIGARQSMDAESTQAPAPTPRRGRRPRRILAIGLVGTGLYAGMLGSGAAAEPVAPAIAPDPSPEPPPPIEAPAVVPAALPEPPPPIEAPAVAPAASPAPPPVDAPAATSAVSPGPVDAGPAPAPPTVSAGPPAEAPEVGTRDRRRATRKPPRKPNASVGSGRLEHPPTSAVRAEPQPSRDAPPPGVAAFPLAGPATSIAVPDFFVGRFRIPPVLLPIYQAAAVRYGVRWQILAAINEIESDYGRNLSVSSAGALGWMQFMPATWKAYGVDANRDGLEDPYNPSDAIFAAARYLRATGAAHDLRRAIYAYNHADWYVDSVLMRARLITALPYGALASLTWLGRGRSPVPRASRTTTAGVGGHRIRIFARRAARVVAVNDGTIVRVGHSARFGRYVKLRDYSGNTYTYARLNDVASNERSRERRGARIPAGAVLGRVGHETGGRAGSIVFAIRPAGRAAPRIDPRPILAGWTLSQSAALGHVARGAAPASAGRILAMSKQALAARVLADPRIQIYACGRDDIRDGAIDRRVLATLELLAESDLRPTVSSLNCGHSRMTTSGNVSEHATGSAVDIAAINGVPILGHQGLGSLAELVVRRLLALDGPMKPHQIITLMQFAGADNTVAMADHADHIHIGWRPHRDPGVGPRLDSTLDARQWIRLFDRLGKLDASAGAREEMPDSPRRRR
jgi:murein DD-endopeptidase MepM/ murein hydrolase activator NlpD